MITPPGEKCGLFDSLVSVLFPATCVVCQCPVEALGCGVVCRPCWQRVGQLDGFLCDLCGYAFASRNLPAGTMLCAACRRGFFSFDSPDPTARLEDPLQEIIHQFKYGSHPSLARPLARLLHALWVQDCRDLAPDMILPVPLHKARQRERGFNPSLAAGPAPEPLDTSASPGPGSRQTSVHHSAGGALPQTAAAATSKAHSEWRIGRPFRGPGGPAGRRCVHYRCHLE